jgi:hypothetical protein
MDGQLVVRFTLLALLLAALAATLVLVLVGAAGAGAATEVGFVVVAAAAGVRGALTGGGISAINTGAGNTGSAAGLLPASKAQINRVRTDRNSIGLMQGLTSSRRPSVSGYDGLICSGSGHKFTVARLRNIDIVTTATTNTSRAKADLYFLLGESIVVVAQIVQVHAVGVGARHIADKTVAVLCGPEACSKQVRIEPEAVQRLDGGPRIILVRKCYVRGHTATWLLRVSTVNATNKQS